MDRKVFINLHLLLAAFFAPAILLVTLSGGLYLAGIKGSVEKEVIHQSDVVSINSNSPSLKKDVTALLAEAGVEDYSFEYVKVKGTTLYTRPTSSDHYVITLKPMGLEIVHARPSLQNRLVELHKGHGPAAFKTYQKVFALGLLFVVLSGLWLGISAERLRKRASLTLGAGVLVVGILLI